MKNFIRESCSKQYPEHAPIMPVKRRESPYIKCRIRINTRRNIHVDLMKPLLYSLRLNILIE